MTGGPYHGQDEGCLPGMEGGQEDTAVLSGPRKMTETAPQFWKNEYICMSSSANRHDMKKNFEKMHIVLTLQGRAKDELFRIAKAKEDEVSQIEYALWQFETDIESENQLKDITRFLLMNADIASIKEGDAFRDHFTKFVRKHFKNLD